MTGKIEVEVGGSGAADGNAEDSESVIFCG